MGARRFRGRIEPVYEREVVEFAMDGRDWDQRYTDREPVSRGPNVFVAEFVAGLAPGRALDLACGEGRNAIWMAGRGWDVTAVDFSAVALARARSLASARGADVNWVEADLLEYQPPVGAFDLAVVAYLQLPPLQRRWVFRRAAASVAPDGFLFVVGHDTTNLGRGVGGPRDATVLFTPADVVADLAGLPLEMERAEHVNRPVERDDVQGMAIDALVVARSVGALAPSAPDG